VGGEKSLRSLKNVPQPTKPCKILPPSLRPAKSCPLPSAAIHRQRASNKRGSRCGAAESMLSDARGRCLHHPTRFTQHPHSTTTTPAKPFSTPGRFQPPPPLHPPSHQNNRSGAAPTSAWPQSATSASNRSVGASGPCAAKRRRWLPTTFPAPMMTTHPMRPSCLWSPM